MAPLLRCFSKVEKITLFDLSYGRVVGYELF